MSTVFISVITINYNDKVGLEHTIQSVQNQTASNFEHIIIDGNSTDGSVDVIKANKACFSYWISEPDTGVYNAMNKGIKAAKGDFLLFLNSGDTFYNDAVLKEASLKINDQYSIYYGDVIRIYDDKKSIKKTYPKTLSFSFFVDSALAHQTVFIKKQLLETYSYYNENFKILSDWEFLIVAICKDNIPYKHLDLVIANYDMNGISSQPEGRVVMKEERMLTYKKHFPLLIEDFKHIIDKQEVQAVSVQNKIEIVKSNKWLKSILKGVTNMLYALLKFKRKL